MIQATDRLLQEVLGAIEACALSVKETVSDVSAERCARAAKDLAETYAILQGRAK